MNSRQVNQQLNAERQVKKVEKIIKIAAEIDEDHIRACWKRSGIGLQNEVDQNVLNQLEEDMSQIDLPTIEIESEESEESEQSDDDEVITLMLTQAENAAVVKKLKQPTIDTFFKKIK